MADFDPTDDGDPDKVRELAGEFTANLETILANEGQGAAFEVVFGALSGLVVFMAKTAGAAYTVESLLQYVEPLQLLLSQYGGEGVGVRQ